jgi:hypothetical protein
MPKVCILYSGLIRNYEKYINSHLKTFENIDSDMYFYGYSNGYSNEEIKIFFKSFKFKEAYFLEYNLDLKNYLLYDAFNNDPTINNIRPEARIDNIISMFYTNKQCFNLVKNKYDFCIKMRTDIETNIIIDDNFLNKIKENNSIEIGWRETCKAVYPLAENDLFCISSFDNYKTYASVYDKLKDYKKLNDVPFHPESLLGHHLHTNNIKINTFIKDDAVLLHHHSQRINLEQEKNWGIQHNYAF